MGSLASALRTVAHALQPAPRVYVDANVPASVVRMMRRELGWDVLFVVEDDNLRRAADRVHFTRALELGRTLVTLDRDFADPARFPPALGPGVLVCSVPDDRWLRRCLRHLDRDVLRRPASDGLPLRGQTLLVTPDSCAPPPAAPTARR